MVILSIRRSSKNSRGSKRARSELADAAAAEVGPENPIHKSSDAVVPVEEMTGIGGRYLQPGNQAYNGSPV